MLTWPPLWLIRLILPQNQGVGREFEGRAGLPGLGHQSAFPSSRRPVMGLAGDEGIRDPAASRQGRAGFKKG